MRGVSMPRIGTGHSEYPGGIFSLLHDPGGIVHTPRSGAQVSGFVDVDNDDPTANWSKTLLLRLGIPKAAVTPWNAFGAYGERSGVHAIRDNVPLCQEFLDKASPIAVTAQGGGLGTWQSIFVSPGPCSVCLTPVAVVGPAIVVRRATSKVPFDLRTNACTESDISTA